MKSRLTGLQKKKKKKQLAESTGTIVSPGSYIENWNRACFLYETGLDPSWLP